MALRVVTGVLGLLFLVQALGWIANPGDAALGLGMPLLEGLGRSTQVGDFAAFFFALGTMCAIGAYRSSAQWLRAAALLVGSAAIMRTLAWLLHDAAFAAMFIAVEAVSAGVLLVVASRFDATPSE